VKIDNGFNLYVDVTSACNASCPFCIAPTVGRKDGIGFLSGLQWGLTFTEKHDGSVQVTGGEPSFSRRLPIVLNEVGNHSFHRKVFNSNGSGIDRRVVGLFLDAGITHVNLSRHHYVEQRNQEVMRFSHAEWGSDERFKAAVRLIHEAGILVRVNCNLLAGYVDSVSSMERFVSWCESFGVNDVAFSETFHLGMYEHNLPIESGYAEKMGVDLQYIVRRLDAEWNPVYETASEKMASWGQTQWISSFLVGGHRRFWNTSIGGQISIKTMAGWNQDGTPKPPIYSKADDPELRDGEIYFAVVHPDGVVSASWDKSERKLFVPSDLIVLEPLKMKGDFLEAYA
jgi:MoaA/NifB/PqqE/SkfB family radical SAM enzyme